MEFELFLHGTPKGQDLWGKEEDRNYFTGFYNGSQDEQQFLIETRPSNKKCYYHYLVYKNMADSDGRSGAYFGLSIRLDVYCKNYANIYRILDYLYNSFVLSKILNVDGNRLRYAVYSFKEADDVAKVMEQTAIQLFQKGFKKEDFQPASDFPTPAGNTVKANLYECTQENVLAALKKYGKVAMSPFYPTRKEQTLEQQHQAQLQDMQKRCTVQIQSEREKADSEKAELRNQVAAEKKNVERIQADVQNQIAQATQDLQAKSQQLQQSLTQRESEAQKLNAEIARLKKRVDESQHSETVSKLVATIKDPINKLSQTMGHMFPDSDAPAASAMSRPSKSKSKQQETTPIGKNVPLINFFLLVCVILLLLWALFIKGPAADKTNMEKQAEPATEQPVTQPEQSQPMLEQSQPIPSEKSDTDEPAGQGDEQVSVDM